LTVTRDDAPTFALPISVNDPVNAAILAVSEDRLQGFQADPFGEIAARSGIGLPTVIERIQAMLDGGTIRRVRQTLQTTRLAAGALVAWRVPAGRLDAAFDFMFKDDPFSGHIVVRSTDPGTLGAEYRLWTTLKVPAGYSLTAHCDYLATQAGAESYRAMPAKALFVLGVGHVRRRTVEPGARADEPADITYTERVHLTAEEWRVLEALKREFGASELQRDLWDARAAEAGVSLDEFCAVARDLETKGVVGRFSTFLEHVKPSVTGERVTRYNALFHWRVPAGREIEAGREIGRHHIMTHAYWREAGPEFGGVNVMGVTHGLEKDTVMAHKEAIDRHLASLGIPVAYTNVFWGGRSEIKPSEVLPSAYRRWCESRGIDPASMRE
jgi:DNA-binding Lrp family transcriptional regulator